MYKCKICENEFELKIGNHYTARDSEETKLGLANLCGTDKEATLYDTFDCPYCGCQNIIQERKRFWCGSGSTITDVVEPGQCDQPDDQFDSGEEDIVI